MVYHISFETDNTFRDVTYWVLFKIIGTLYADSKQNMQNFFIFYKGDKSIIS